MRLLCPLTILVLIFYGQTLLADVHFAISESLVQINGKSEIDNTNGNLTSLFSPGVQAVILANFSQKLKLNFSGTYLRPSFKAPSGRTLKKKEMSLSQYSAGPVFLLSPKSEMRLNLGFEDYPYYKALTQNEIALDKNNGSFLALTYKYLLEDFFLSSWEIEGKIAAPLSTDYDQGKPIYGIKLSSEKELKRNQFIYSAGGYISLQHIPMTKIIYNKTDMGIYFSVKIPLKTKNIL